LGILHLQSAQLKRLAVAPRARLSPLLEKCCLRVCANESYQNAQADLKALIGIEIGHSSLHRCVQRQDFAVSEPLEMIEAVSIDGGKVRLRAQQKGQASNWRDYKAVRLNCTYFGAWFQDNASLSAWVNAQRLSQPLVCLGDGHDGIWNLFKDIAIPQQRQEILDWFHLKENLFKVDGSLNRIRQAEALLWHGEIEAAKGLFTYCRRQQAKNFCAYLDHHRSRIVNYAYCQTMLLKSIPIGSGAVESAVKQIDHRLKLSGAQWKAENVNQMLTLRCVYLNGALDVA
jgi:hypothetical protein